MQFRDVIGQKRIKEILIAGVNSGKISHAQFFVGENGTGGLPLALAYAQYLNCKHRGPEDSCGNCDPCRKTAALEYPDLHFSYPVVTKKAGQKPVSLDYIEDWRNAVKGNPYLTYADWMNEIEAENKQGNITAEECRDIIRKLSLKPMYEGFKIMLIWMPENLGKEGNMLLKIMEEPPDNTVFLLVGEDEESVLPTILSRTQVLRIPRIDDSSLSEALEKDLGMSADETAPIVHLANGNYHNALKLFREGENNYTEEFKTWMRATFKLTIPDLLSWIDKMASTGRENQKNFLLYSITMMRESVLTAGKLDEIAGVMDTEKVFVEKFSSFINFSNIDPVSKLLSSAHYHIERNGNPKIIFFNLSLKINKLFRVERKSA